MSPQMQPAPAVKPGQDREVTVEGVKFKLDPALKGDPKDHGITVFPAGERRRIFYGIATFNIDNPKEVVLGLAPVPGESKKLQLTVPEPQAVFPGGRGPETMLRTAVGTYKEADCKTLLSTERSLFPTQILSGFDRAVKAGKCIPEYAHNRVVVPEAAKGFLQESVTSKLISYDRTSGHITFGPGVEKIAAGYTKVGNDHLLTIVATAGAGIPNENGVILGGQRPQRVFQLSLSENGGQITGAKWTLLPEKAVFP